MTREQELQAEFDQTCKGKTISHIQVENDGGNVVLFFSDHTIVSLSADVQVGQPFIQPCELESVVQPCETSRGPTPP